MSDTENTSQQIVSDADAKQAGSTDADLWLKKIKAAEDELKEWREAACVAIDAFEAKKGKSPDFNLFHSNIQTTLPALYNSTPIADVRRRYGDKDPVGKMVVDITERALAYSCDQYPFDKYIRATVKDGEVAGRGTVRIRQRNEFSQMMGPDGQPVDDVSYQEVLLEPVKWDKWGHGPALYWEDVPFVYFKHELDADDLRELMGEDNERLKKILEDGLGDGEDKGKKKSEVGVYKTLSVLEVWDKRRREILFLAERIKDFPLKVVPDELGLTGFFPVPPPLQPIERLGNLVPVTPYQVYQHLLAELDDTTKRIRKLVKQLKVRGIVAGDLEADALQVKDLDDGEYAVSKNAIQFAAGPGGLDKAIHHWPMDPTVLAVKQLVEQRELTKQLIYEVTGISDILRGASNANETLGAQQIKTQWGSLRLQDRQGEVARFCRDIFRMKTELIAKFKPEVLSMMTGLPQTEQDQQLFPQAIQLLQDNMARRFRIDVETDSTVRADMSRNQEQMNQFIQGTAMFVQGMTQAAQIAPQMLPAMIEVFLAFARRFKLGKQAEDAIESLSQMGEQMAQMAQQAQQKPSPEEMKLKAEIEFKEREFQLKAQAQQQDLQFKAQEHQMTMKFEREKMQMESEREDWRMTQENAREERRAKFEDRKAEREMARGDREHNFKMRETKTAHKLKLRESQATLGDAFPAELLQDDEPQNDAMAEEAGAIKESVQILAQEQQQIAEAMVSGIQQLVMTLQQGLAEQTQVAREAAQATLEMQSRPKRLVKHPDGTKSVEIA